jgi:hypothetical protein
MAAGAVNGAVMRLGAKESTGAVVPAERDGPAGRFCRQASACNLQRPDLFRFALVEGDSPPGPAAGARLAASVARVEAETGDHDDLRRS